AHLAAAAEIGGLAVGRFLLRLLPAERDDGRNVGLGDWRSPRLALERRFDERRELRLLARRALGMAPLETRQDRFGEQLHGFADVFVAVLAALLHEDHLVDARILELAQMPLDLLGRADGAGAPARDRQKIAGPLVVRPDAGAPGQVLAEDVMMA